MSDTNDPIPDGATVDADGTLFTRESSGDWWYPLGEEGRRPIPLGTIWADLLETAYHTQRENAALREKIKKQADASWIKDQAMDRAARVIADVKPLVYQATKIDDPELTPATNVDIVKALAALDLGDTP